MRVAAASGPGGDQGSRCGPPSTVDSAGILAWRCGGVGIDLKIRVISFCDSTCQFFTY